MAELLKATGLVKDYKVPKLEGWFGSATTRALDGVDLSLDEGESLAVVGESGSGKSTLGRALLWLDPPDEGSVVFGGKALASLGASDLRRQRRDLQMIFQDPYASLDPRQKVGDIVTENLQVHADLKGSALGSEAARLLRSVGLEPDMAERFVHEFSGGQRQRIAIARAIATKPRLLIADEPVSALDLELQGQILDLLKKLRAGMGLSLIFITHDLKLVKGFCRRVLVMKDAKVVERGLVEEVFSRPAHAYTRELLDAVLPLPLPRAALRVPETVEGQP
ncbi:MAG TPA: ATP-binding cassette domain-containing protein [bacterium]|jgi:peptide/nickel transport system ATP-binding protein|nr:ATP-binding cassette domain-containing protein [bacterium]